MITQRARESDDDDQRKRKEDYANVREDDVTQIKPILQSNQHSRKPNDNTEREKGELSSMIMRVRVCVRATQVLIPIYR